MGYDSSVGTWLQSTLPSEEESDATFDLVARGGLVAIHAPLRRGERRGTPTDRYLVQVLQSTLPSEEESDLLGLAARAQPLLQSTLPSEEESDPMTRRG